MAPAMQPLIRYVLLTTLLCTLSLDAAQSAPKPSKVEELTDRMLDSPDGVIQFDNEDFEKYIDGTTRPYSIILIATAKQLMDKSGLNLRQLRKNFGLAGNALKRDVLAQHRAGGEGAFAKKPVFLVALELHDAQQAFSRMEIKMLPFVIHIAPNIPVPSGAPVSIPDDDKMDANQFPDYPWKPGTFVSFIRDAAGYAIPVPEASSVFKSRFFPVVALVVMGMGALLAYKLYYSPIVRFKPIYLLGGLFIYWFSVSGGMYNIIRGMPLLVPREEGPQLFLQGQGQLGAEGFIMGATYTSFGIAFALLSLVAPRFRSTWVQRLVCYPCLGVAMFSLSGLLQTYKWKLGYHVHSYFFRESFG